MMSLPVNLSTESTKIIFTDQILFWYNLNDAVPNYFPLLQIVSVVV
jgi:hypothetical protein